MKDHIILAFGGNLGCGKSTVSKQIKAVLDAAYISTEYNVTVTDQYDRSVPHKFKVMSKKNYDVAIIAVGSGIRDELIEYYGLDRDLVYDPKRKMEEVSLENISDEAIQWWYDYGIVEEGTDIRAMKMTVRKLLQTQGTGVRRTHFGEDYWDNIFKKKVANFLDDDSGMTKVVIVDDFRFMTEAKILEGLCAHKYRIEQYEGYDKDISHSSEHDLDFYEGWDDRFYPKHGAEHLFNTVTKPVLEEVFGLTFTPLIDRMYAGQPIDNLCPESK